jgi:uncharacterized protein (DUF2062 family)
MPHRPDARQAAGDAAPHPHAPAAPSGRPGLRARCARVIDIVEANAGTPHRTAAALALGVFLSFSPFLGLQILIGMAAAFLLRLSRIVVLVGLCANLPWIMVPWYALTTAGAAALLGVGGDADIGARIAELLSMPIYRPAFWVRSAEFAAAFFWPFVIGPTTGALVLALIAYVASLRLLVRRAGCRPATGGASTRFPGDAEERAADRHVGDAQSPRFQP